MVIPNPLVMVETLPDETGREDIRFTILGLEWISDSYYLIIDPDFKARWPSLDGEPLVRHCLHALFEQWLDLLRNPAADRLFLPFDFSDQGTASLRIVRVDAATLDANVGWSSVEGWSLSPSDIRPSSGSAADFDPQLPTDLRLPRQSLLDDLERVLGQLA